MGRRQDIIARSITHAISRSDPVRVSVLSKISAFFYLYWLIFRCVSKDLFKSLRAGVWQIDEDEYQEAFGANDKEKAKLKAMGTANSKMRTKIQTS